MELIFAVPTANGQICAHFGHCESFAIIRTSDNRIISKEFINPPVHQPGVYPRFLAGLGVNVIISGGMGIKAQELFAMNKIRVYYGVSSGEPDLVVRKYLDNELQTGENLCDH